MQTQPSPALNQPLAAPATAIPLLSNYLTNCNRSLEDMEEDQMAQEDQKDQKDQEDEVDQVDPTSQTQPPLNNPSNQLQT